MAKLIFTDKRLKGREYEFVVEKNTVGRGDPNTLVIRDNSVSERHCEILVFGTEVIIRDLGSKNGTFVNGVRLHNQQCQVLAGQVVRIGLIEARLELEEPPPSGTETDVTAAYAFCRFEREQRKPPKAQGISSLPLEPSPHSSLPAGTVMLARPPQSETSPIRAAPAMVNESEKRSRMEMVALFIVAFFLGLAVILYLAWRRG